MLHTLLHSEHETIVDRAASRIHWITFKWPPAIIDRLLELLSVSDWRHASSAAASALARHHADDPKMLGRVLDYAEEEPMMALDALHQFRASTFSDEHISQLIAIVPEMRAVMHSNYDYGTLMRHIGPRVIPHVHRRLDTASADEHQTLKQISTMFESM